MTTPARTIKLLQLTDQISAPAPDDAAKRSELATIMARMEGDYGAGKYCVTKNGKEECRNIDQLAATIAKSRNYDELTEAWAGWHSVGRQMRKDYSRFVELAGEGAREIGFADLGAMWRSPYDMKPEEFEIEVDRLWGQVKPLYDQMHCYARTQLAVKYGEDKVPRGQADPGPAVRQPVGAAVEQHLRRHPQAVPGREGRKRGCCAGSPGLHRREDGEAGRVLLHLAGHALAAADLLGTLPCSPARATVTWCAMPAHGTWT